MVIILNDETTALQTIICFILIYSIKLGWKNGYALYLCGSKVGISN